MISIQHIILIIIVLCVVIVASNSTYYQALMGVYKSIKKIPKIIIVLTTILSIVGLGHLMDFSALYKRIEKKPFTNFKETTEDGKRNVSETTKKIVASKQNWKCGLCDKTLDETYEVDHVVPLYKGGSNDITNLMALDPICHRKKTNSDRLNVPLEKMIIKEKDKP